MTEPFEEMKLYRNFDELASDVLDLAKELFPEQLLYVSAIERSEQLILKLSNEHADIQVSAGMVIDLEYSLCNRMDFENERPLVYEDTTVVPELAPMQGILAEANVQSYLGIPITLTNGETFGTLCAIHDETSRFDEKSVMLLQRIAKLFSYYLELEQFAWKDALTHLYNRRYLTKFKEDHPNHPGALFYLDLDGFKRVNDRYGHETGDVVLLEVARRLQASVRPYAHAFAVRLGGDEFILQFIHQATRTEWESIATDVLRRINSWETPYHVSTSIGIVTYEAGSGDCLKTTLQQADLALYAAKSAGKNTYHFF